MTRKQFEEMPGGEHVILTCLGHPDLEWSCKALSVSIDDDGLGRYNGHRNIFFRGHKNEPRVTFAEIVAGTAAVECSCPVSHLVLVFEPEAV